MAIILAGEFIHQMETLPPGEERGCFVQGVVFGIGLISLAGGIVGGVLGGVIISAVLAAAGAILDFPSPWAYFFGKPLLNI